MSQMPQMGGMDSIVPVNGMQHTRRHPGSPGGMPGDPLMHHQFMLQREMQRQGGYPNIHQVVGGRMPIPQMGGVPMMNPVNAVVHNPYTQQPYGGYGAFGQQSPSPYGQMQGGGVHGRAPFSSSNIPMEMIIGRQQTPHSFPPNMDMFSPFQNNEDQSSSNPKQMDHMQTEMTAAPASPQPQSSLPKFLQGGPQWAVDEFKRIIRTPKSTYAEQVKQIEKMVEKLDGSRQDLYKKFMQVDRLYHMQSPVCKYNFCRRTTR